MASVKIKMKKTMTPAQQELLNKIVQNLYAKVFQPAEPWPASFGATEISPWERSYGSFLQQALGMPQTAPGSTLGQPIVPQDVLYPTTPAPAPAPSPTPAPLPSSLYQEALTRALREAPTLSEAQKYASWYSKFMNEPPEWYTQQPRPKPNYNQYLAWTGRNPLAEGII